MKPAEIASYVQNLGLVGFGRYAARRAAERWALSKAPYKLYSRNTRFPLWCRPRSSDLDMFAEIICHRAFRCLDSINSAQLIVDCGANVGYSSAYMLTRYPSAKVIAIEPDADNFSMLEQNLTPYAGRYMGICSAVWSHRTGLVLSQEQLGAGNECARTVRPVRDGEVPAIMALDIGTVLEQSGFDRISILKVDIEGAERVVFASNYKAWLGRVDNIVIELHDAECIRVFETAIASENFAVSTCDDQTVCLRPVSGAGDKRRQVTAA
jgi:FkbM family methyltransferase